LKTRLEPFGLAEGRLFLDGVDLTDVAAGLEGRPAWLIGGAAVLATLKRTRVTIAVGAVGPPAVLALLAKAGCWAAVASGHELRLAQQAGFPAPCIAVDAPVLDDGLIMEALSARVAVLRRRGRDEAARIARIGRALALPRPKAKGGPASLSARAFARCGGLLARLLSGPPDLVLDAVWEPAASLTSAARTTARFAPLVVSLSLASASAGRPARLRGLTSTRARPARLLGAPAVGDWVVVLAEDALAVRPPHPAWPLPRSVLVSGGLWRDLDPRPMPPSD
jgi:hypothetical protein